MIFQIRGQSLCCRLNVRDHLSALNFLNLQLCFRSIHQAMHLFLEHICMCFLFVVKVNNRYDTHQEHKKHSRKPFVEDQNMTSLLL